MNPLDVLGVRELSILPDHFVKTIVDDANHNKVKHWIHNHLSGRFCVLTTPAINKNSLKLSTVVAFENKSELTYFLLACPYTRR